MEKYVTETVPVELINGDTVYMEVRNTLRQKVANPKYSFKKIAVQIDEISETIKDSFLKSKPSKVNVELGFELSVESGELSALLVRGNGKANIKVILEWDDFQK